MDIRFEFLGGVNQGSKRFTQHVQPKHFTEIFDFKGGHFGDFRLHDNSRFPEFKFSVAYRSTTAKARFHAECKLALTKAAPSFPPTQRSDALGDGGDPTDARAVIISGQHACESKPHGITTAHPPPSYKTLQPLVVVMGSLLSSCLSHRTRL